MTYLDPWRDAPEGKQINGFTLEIEDAAPLSLNPDPAEQRILSNNPIDLPLAELNTLYKEGKIDLNGEPMSDEQEVEAPVEVEETPEVEEAAPVEEEPAQEETTDDVPVQASSDDSDTEDVAGGTPEQV